MSSSARLGRRSALALAGSIATLSLSAAAANADFTLTKCAGSSVKGIGSSFQNNAEAGFIDLFASANGCSGTPTIDPYQPDGSGAGRQAFGERSGTNTTGARNPAFRYIGVDEAPNPAQQAQINSGPVDANNADVSAGDDGKIRTIPIAVGSTALVVNYPDGCDLPAASATGSNGPGSGDQSSRLKLTAVQTEKVFAATTATWGALVPNITELSGSGRAAGSCAAQPIRRIVRFDDSGTTFSLKAWLDTINGATQWTGSLYGKTPNTTWPTVGGGSGTPKAIASGACDTDLCSGTAKGGGQLVNLAAATDGSIGYADLRTARQGGFELNAATYAIPPAPTNADTTYWIPVQNKVDSAYYEPTSDANGFKPGGNPGANCALATFSNLPTDTFGDFSKVVAVNSPTGYPLCVPTYIEAWDDYASVYGSSDAEQAKARTVRTFLDMVLGPVAQQSLVARDYQALPQSLLTLAQGGSALIGWNKGNTGTQPTPTATATASVTPTPTAGGSPTPTPTPSNTFTVNSAKVSKKGGKISLSLVLPGSGAVSVGATAGKLNVGSAAGNATGQGALSVTITPTKKALKKLKTVKKLKVSLAIQFTPTGGSPAQQSKTITLKGSGPVKKPAKHHKKKHHKKKG